MTESSCCQEDGDACGPFLDQEREIERLRALLKQARHHVSAALGLTEDNRLALAVQGRRLVRDLDAELGGDEQGEHGNV